MTVNLESCKAYSELPKTSNASSVMAVSVAAGAGPVSTALPPAISLPVVVNEAEVLHRLVLFLGKQEHSAASWEELLAALASKHPDLSKKRLRRIVSANKNLLSVVNKAVLLCELDHAFVGHYFDLAEGVAKVNLASSSAPFSLDEPCQVQVANSILVSGIVCVFERKDNSALFQFDNQHAYRLKSPLKGDYKQGQRLSSVLRLRKIVLRKLFLKRI